ncbi:MAG TPA: hypothetical protein VN922_14430 [Bacteroidia bacterium]|nr:hypothetical protein [Bacteroidia bacterium]
MKTTLTFIFVCSLGIIGFSQTKTTTTIKTKPTTAAKVTTTASAKPDNSVHSQEKPRTIQHCKMEKSCTHLTSRYMYECPKCSYESQDSGTGKCPNDGYKLRYVHQTSL